MAVHHPEAVQWPAVRGVFGNEHETAGVLHPPGIAVVALAGERAVRLRKPLFFDSLLSIYMQP